MAIGTLYIVSTPIGNLEDITLRAIRTLREVDVIAAEDTRHTGILLARHGIQKRLTSFHSYNKTRAKESIIAFLKEGKSVALVSDAGTPGISDPGYSLIREVIDGGMPLVSIPGPTALIEALILSGKPTAKFIFEGFLSNKKAQRRKRLEFLKDEKRTIVIYESCHRIRALLEDVSAVMDDRYVAVARELTKKFEEVKRDRASVLAGHFRSVKPRGEFIVVI